MPQQVPKHFSGSAPRDRELSSEVGCFRDFGLETVQGLSKYLDSLLLCDDEEILLKQLLFRLMHLAPIKAALRQATSNQNARATSSKSATFPVAGHETVAGPTVQGVVFR
jgi:hypothetical protein